MKTSFLLFVFAFSTQMLFAQFTKPTLDLDKSKGETVGQRSEIIQAEPAGFINPKQRTHEKDWEVNFRSISKGFSHDIPNRAQYFAAKARKNDLKARSEAKLQGQFSDSEVEENLEKAVEIETNKVRGFRANRQNGYYPPDNSIAISDNGYIVSLVNSGIEYYNTSGNRLYSKSFYDFFVNTQ